MRIVILTIIIGLIILLYFYYKNKNKNKNTVLNGKTDNYYSSDSEDSGDSGDGGVDSDNDDRENTQSDNKNFIQSDNFTGPIENMIFTTRNGITGYYLDDNYHELFSD